MQMAAVLPKVEPLPGAEQHTAIGKRHSFARAGESHLDVTGHVVRAFERVLKMRIAFRNQPFEPSFEIGTRRRIGVFHDHETATRVLAKDRDRTTLESTARKFSRNLFGDLVQAFAARADRECGLSNRHGETDLRPSPGEAKLNELVKYKGRAWFASRPPPLHPSTVPKT